MNLPLLTAIFLGVGVVCFLLGYYFRIWEDRPKQPPDSSSLWTEPW